MDSSAHYRFASIGDALASVHELVVRESGSAMEGIRRRVRLHTPRRGLPVLRVDGETPEEAAKFRMLGKLVQDASIERMDWQSLDDVLASVRLNPARIKPGTTLLALPKTSATMERLIVRLADLRVPNQRVVTFLQDDARYEGIQFECPPISVDAHSLGLSDAELYADIGREKLHFVPAGYTHPVIQSFPALMPPMASEDTLFWHPGELPRSGTWRAARREDEWRRPIEFVDLEPLESEPTPIVSARLGTIPLRLEPRRIGERVDRTGLQVVVEITDQSGGTTEARLLDLLDDLEVGEYSPETLVWVHRNGRSRASGARYFVRAGSLPGPEAPSVPGVRVFVQPRSMRDRGIPMYLEAKCVLRPNLDALLPALEDEHEVLRGLRDLFPVPGGDESREVHLVSLGSEGGESRCLVESLQGGRPLRELLGPLRARPLGALVVEAGPGLQQALERRAEVTFQRLEQFAHERMGKLDEEFRAIDQELDRQLQSLEPELVKAHDRHDSAREIFDPLPGLLESVPKSWDEIRDRVLQIEARVVEQRVEWIEGIRRDADSAQQALVARGSELADAVHQAEGALQGLETDHDEVKAGYRELEAFLPRAEAVQAKIRELDERLRRRSETLRTMLKESSDLLVGVGERQAARQLQVEKGLEQLDQADMGVAAEEQRLVAREAERDARRGELERRRRSLGERAEKLRLEEAELERKEDQLDEELDRIEQLERHVLPNLKSEIESIRLALRRKDAEGLMDELQQWIEELQGYLRGLEGPASAGHSWWKQALDWWRRILGGGS